MKATGVGGEGAHHVAWVHELVRAAVRIGHGLRLEGLGDARSVITRDGDERERVVITRPANFFSFLL